MIDVDEQVQPLHRPKKFPSDSRMKLGRPEIKDHYLRIAQNLNRGVAVELSTLNVFTKKIVDAWRHLLECDRIRREKLLFSPAIISPTTT